MWLAVSVLDLDWAFHFANYLLESCHIDVIKCFRCELSEVHRTL